MTRDLWSFFALPFSSLRRVRVSRPPLMNRKKEEDGNLLSAQKVLRGEILGSRRSQSCSGDRLNSNDWTDPGRLTGWQTLVQLRSLPTIYPPPSSFFDLLPAFAIRNLCSIPDFWPNPFFRSPTPVCVNHASEKLRGRRNILSMILTTADISPTCLFFELTFI